jgi:aryl-alcohol dehydrogenase-like predicted oxidoreductase
MSDSDNKLVLGGVAVGLMQWGSTTIDNSFVNPHGNLTDDTCRQIWKACMDRNTTNVICMADTAEGYGGGSSEIRIREVSNYYQTHYADSKASAAGAAGLSLSVRLSDSKQSCSHIVVATKYLPTLWRWTQSAFDKSLRGSLNRLGVECIELYFIHTPIHPMPLENFIQWACDAANDGRIKHIGVSNCSAEQVRRADAVARRNGRRIACNQIMVNMLVWNSSKLQDTIQTCQELGVQIVAYSPIGQGLLTEGLTREKFKTIRATRITGVKFDQLQPLRDEIQALSVKYDKSMAQIAMNWVRQHGAIPLVGCRSVRHVEQAAGSCGWDLSEDDVKSLDALSLHVSIFDKPRWRRSLFVVFISVLQLAYFTEQRLSRAKKWITSWFW